MKKEFVPFETAKKLRAIGFDESCCAFYEAERVVNKPEMVDDKDQYRVSGWRTCKNSEVPTHYFAAATVSQAFRWFREKGYDVKIQKESAGLYFGFYWNGAAWIMVGNGTYEASEQACLDKLIEVVESKSEQDDKRNE